MNRIFMLIGVCALLSQISCESEKEEGKEVETKLLVTSPTMKDTTVLRA